MILAADGVVFTLFVEEVVEGALLRFPFEISAGTLIFIAAAFALSKERGIALRVKKILRPQN